MPRLLLKEKLLILEGDRYLYLHDPPALQAEVDRVAAVQASRAAAPAGVATADALVAVLVRAFEAAVGIFERRHAAAVGPGVGGTPPPRRHSARRRRGAALPEAPPDVPAEELAWGARLLLRAGMIRYDGRKRLGSLSVRINFCDARGAWVVVTTERARWKSLVNLLRGFPADHEPAGHDGLGRWEEKYWKGQGGTAVLLVNGLSRHFNLASPGDARPAAVNAWLGLAAVADNRRQAASAPFRAFADIDRWYSLRDGQAVTLTARGDADVDA